MGERPEKPVSHTQAIIRRPTFAAGRQRLASSSVALNTAALPFASNIRTHTCKLKLAGQL
jgi:hypothetical protein